MKCYCIATKNGKNIVGFYMSGENMEDVELNAGMLMETRLHFIDYDNIKYIEVEKEN